MAKNKGKSKRRIKDWQSRFEADQDVEATRSRRGKFSPREVKLGEGSFAGGGGDKLRDMQRREGIVTGVLRRGAWIRVGQDELFCGLAKTFRVPEGSEKTTPLTVGDDVTVVLVKPEHTDGQIDLDRNRMDGMILSRQARRTLLARPQPTSGKRRTAHDDNAFVKVLAANMDVLLIVIATAKPSTRRGLVDRFLIVAERGELTPILTVNKIDLKPSDKYEEIMADLRSQAVTIFPCSAKTGEGLDRLQTALVGKRSVLAGASGVGKTSLINALVPKVDAATQPVREKDDRGRHTTSQARPYDLPPGGLLVDTPGIRELGVGITPAELPGYFPEFEEFAPQCKFYNCSHTHEPNCAVIQPVEKEKILPRRYESYLRILDTLEEK